jgi:hypothetical protein
MDTQKKFLQTLKQFNELEIQDTINHEQMNEVLISHHSTAHT